VPDKYLARHSGIKVGMLVETRAYFDVKQLLFFLLNILWNVPINYS
jgi:hypothetical protein